MVYDIQVKVEVSKLTNIYCYFSFKNPLTNKTSSMIASKERWESGMKFVERIKQYIASSAFAKDVKKTILKDIDKVSKEDKESAEFQAIKKEFDGLIINVKVDMD